MLASLRFLSVFFFFSFLFNVCRGLPICWEKYQLYLLALVSPLMLLWSSSINDIVHFSLFCQSRTFAVVTLLLFSWFCLLFSVKIPHTCNHRLCKQRKEEGQERYCVMLGPPEILSFHHSFTLFKPDLKQIKLWAEMLSSVKQPFKARRIAHSFRL